MKICKECEKEFQEKVSFEKYCSEICAKKYHYRKEINRRRTDQEYRIKRNKREIDRRQKKRQEDPAIKRKHAEDEKARYRKKNGINSDADLKCAPKGSGTITSHGYRQIISHGHPNCRRDGSMFEHVYIMSQHIGRRLIKGETIHHRNGIRDDNRIENLEIWHRAQPPGQRLDEKIEWCKKFLAIYGYDVLQRN
jgi:hypothetical protein